MAEVALGPLAAQCPHVEGSRHRHPRGMTVVGQAEMAAGARRAPPVAVVAVVASGDVCYCRVPFAVHVWRCLTVILAFSSFAVHTPRAVDAADVPHRYQGHVHGCEDPRGVLCQYRRQHGPGSGLVICRRASICQLATPQTIRVGHHRRHPRWPTNGVDRGAAAQGEGTRPTRRCNCWNCVRRDSWPACCRSCLSAQLVFPCSAQRSCVCVMCGVCRCLLRQDIRNLTSGTGVVWYSMTVRPVDFRMNPFRFMAKYFNIWHEPLRGACREVPGSAGNVICCASVWYRFCPCLPPACCRHVERCAQAAVERQRHRYLSEPGHYDARHSRPCPRVHENDRVSCLVEIHIGVCFAVLLANFAVAVVAVVFVVFVVAVAVVSVVVVAVTVVAVVCKVDLCVFVCVCCAA